MGGEAVSSGGNGPTRKKGEAYYQTSFFEGKTQMEVAEEIGISQAQVSRLEKNALRAMRQYLRSE